MPQNKPARRAWIFVPLPTDLANLTPEQLAALKADLNVAELKRAVAAALSNKETAHELQPQ